jgi:hypothetical protein
MLPGFFVQPLLRLHVILANDFTANQLEREVGEILRFALNDELTAKKIKIAKCSADSNKNVDTAS